MGLLNRRIDQINAENAARIASEASNREEQAKEEETLDPSLFSPAVRSSDLTEASFVALTDFMRSNGVEVEDTFLLNGFESLLEQREAVNSLLDIIDYFSEDGEINGRVWRVLMRMMGIEQPKVDPVGSSRCTLIAAIAKYYNDKYTMISFEKAVKGFLTTPLDGMEGKDQRDKSEAFFEGTRLCNAIGAVFLERCLFITTKTFYFHG